MCVCVEDVAGDGDAAMKTIELVKTVGTVQIVRQRSAVQAANRVASAHG